MSAGVIDVDYATLDKITESFSPQRKIGKGGFATVFYGSLYLWDDNPPEGWPSGVAVKVDKFKYSDATVGQRKSEWCVYPYLLILPIAM